MHVVIWEYTVRPDARQRFESLYGAHGQWVALFRAHAGFIDTQLLLGGDGRYVTIDRWENAQAYGRFQESARAEYARIDVLGDALTVSERCIGAYTSR